MSEYAEDLKQMKGQLDSLCSSLEALAFHKWAECDSAVVTACQDEFKLFLPKWPYSVVVPINFALAVKTSWLSKVIEELKVYRAIGEGLIKPCIACVALLGCSSLASNGWSVLQSAFLPQSSTSSDGIPWWIILAIFSSATVIALLSAYQDGKHLRLVQKNHRTAHTIKGAVQ